MCKMNVWKGKIISEMPFGHIIIVSGKIKPNPNKISLALTDSVNENDEPGTVLLNIEANFRENQIIRSMYHPGDGWSQEEISKNWIRCTPKNPLVPGEIFNFRIAALQKCFEIYVNEKLYGTFDHLQSPKIIKYVVISGDFEKIISFHQRQLFPLVFPKHTTCCEKVCFQSDVPKKYDSGTIVVTEGIARGPPNTEYSICFQCNETGRIFLKFHVDFGNKTVIRSYQRDDYKFHTEDEERDGEFPFKRGKLFKIAFGLAEKAFVIAINGKFYTYFNFPYSPFAISTIKCFCNDPGELSITNIEYHTETPLIAKVEKLSGIAQA